MNLLFAAVVGVLFGSGVFLLLKPDLFRVVTGLVLVSNAANLTLMASGLSRGAAPIAPSGEPVADALVQAMTLTALVIGFAVAAVLLALCLGVYRSHHSVDLEELARRDVTQAGVRRRRELAYDEAYERDEGERQEPRHHEMRP